MSDLAKMSLWTYVALATLSSLASPSSAEGQQSSTYSYDAHGRVVSSSASAGKTTTYSHDFADNRSHRKTYNQMTISWEAEDLPHGSGFREADGWASNIHQPAAHMTYGPFSTNVPVGSGVAVWSILVDHNIGSDNDEPVAVLDVRDANTGEQLAHLNLTRNKWRAPWSYQTFELPFTVDPSRAGHSFEFRTYHVPTIHMRVDRIGYRPGMASETIVSWDARTLPHGSGYQEADGWASDIHQPAAHMTYGPYTTDVPVGHRVAVWNILVDHNIGSDTDEPVAVLDVWDATAGQQLAAI